MVVLFPFGIIEICSIVLEIIIVLVLPTDLKVASLK